jgi:hypothetical protein
MSIELDGILLDKLYERSRRPDVNKIIEAALSGGKSFDTTITTTTYEKNGKNERVREKSRRTQRRKQNIGGNGENGKENQ